MSDVNLFITDRDGDKHQVLAPTDMAMNLMEVIKSYELAPEGTIGICGGMAMCASCHCYITSNHSLSEMQEEEEAMLSESFNVKENSMNTKHILGSSWSRTPATKHEPSSVLAVLSCLRFLFFDQAFSLPSVHV